MANVLIETLPRKCYWNYFKAQNSKTITKYCALEQIQENNVNVEDDILLKFILNYIFAHIYF
jgi:hypothetical protein